MKLRTLLPLALLLAGACAPLRSRPQLVSEPLRRETDRLGQTEIREAHLNDAYEAVRALRPNWLRKRGQLSVMQPSDIVTYLDNVQLGGPEMLRTIPTSAVLAIQFLNASSATQRWGTGHVHGAILVTTLR
jgi:hypothetical protein